MSDRPTNRFTAASKSASAGLQAPSVFALAVRRRLDDLRITQRSLAAALGCCESQVSRWLKGEQALAVDELGAVVRVVGPRPVQLLLEPEGYTVVPTGDMTEAVCVLLEVLELQGDAAAVAHETAAAIADRVINRAEAERLDRALLAVRDRVDGMRAALGPVRLGTRTHLPVQPSSDDDGR